MACPPGGHRKGKIVKELLTNPIFWVIVVVLTLAGIALGYLLRRQTAERKIQSAEEEARKILNTALHQAETKRRELLVDARDAAQQIKDETEAELKERRREVSRQEHRIAQKEEAFDAKMANLEASEADMRRRRADVERLEAEAQEHRRAQIAELERIATMTADEAKAELLHRLESELEHETALRINEFEAHYREETNARARNLLSLAIARCAADHVSEVAISVVPLPNEDMKGRIIGREGRNIRTIEQLTGVELIIDDTPEAITVSGFDPVRREVARIAIERRIADGRIHPARIEEMVEKARREVDEVIRKAGEAAVFETGVHGLHSEEIKLLGRLKFRTSFGQNVLRHSVEVSLLAGILADELGVDGTLARRAGLLHDIGKALTAESEGTHIQLGVEVARKYKENKEVIHASEAHHNDVEPQTALALIVQAADAISAARPGARREDVENYIKRLQRLEEIASEFSGVEKTFAIQAGREVRVMVKPEVISDDRMAILAREIAKKIEGELDYPGQIKVNIIRECRLVDYAK